ncbi:ORF164 [White spot syndrome virus]|uniref:Wsv097 n=3 Tax=White spot syndrome virus TaxID=342409 RepID=Q8VB86_WSSVS|nr:wsv097 [Shrimp white spot syndrome virus]AFX59474.1 wsv097 [White spot syndrome virus]AYW76524.1 hypothetical protein [Procambarus clarkii virus]AAL33101.1 wsv097 [Shrimp white spot syndrome virus]AAL89021.1 WSSV153 [Shrimp white spot syndrome virus]ATU83657.1 ORF164 [White spot syndrome virus]
MLIVQHACRHQIVMQKHSLKAIIKATLVNTLLPPQVIRNRTNNAQSILKMSRRLLYSLHLVLEVLVLRKMSLVISCHASTQSQLGPITRSVIMLTPLIM